MLHNFIKFNGGGYFYVADMGSDVRLYTTHGNQRVMDSAAFRKLCADGDVEVIDNGKATG